MNLQLGIRATLYLGLGAMLAVVVFVTLSALFATSRVGDSARDIVDVHLPETVETLRVARSADALLAAGSRVVMLVLEPHSGNIPENAREVIDTLASATRDFPLISPSLNHVPALTTQLSTNLKRLEVIARERLAHDGKRERLRERLLLNLQSFQEHLTHRTRLLQGDGDVLARLITGESPDVTRIAGIAQNITELLSTMRFYAEIEAIHGRLQSAGQDPSLIALALSQSILRSQMQGATRTYEELPQAISDLISPAFGELDALINADHGQISLRRAELELFSEGQRLVEENRTIGLRIDAETRVLVNDRMRGIDEAAAIASHAREHYVVSIWVATLIGIAGLAALMYFQIHRRLVRRLAWLSSAMQQVAAGQVDTELPPEGDDELGRLGRALRQFRTTEVTHRRQEDELRASNEKAAEALDALEQANRKLADLSTRDGLTGLANRRYFDQALQIERARACHAHRPLALLMIDVDHFKRFNDFYGHQAGDDCLKQVAAAIKSQARRASDVVARYGGEEFCVISAYTDGAASNELAHSIRDAVKRLGIAHQDSSEGTVTVSIGYAVADVVEGLSAEALLAAADKALYASKEKGRNRVEQGSVESDGR